MNLIKVNVKYRKIDENGKERKVNEPYLVDALSFTEAETRITKEMEPYYSTEFTVSAVSKTNYTDMFQDEQSDKYYKCKVSFVSIDEEKGTVKKTANYMLVQAESIQDALDNLNKGLEGMIVDFEINAISETKIIEVYNYDPTFASQDQEENTDKN